MKIVLCCLLDIDENYYADFWIKTQTGIVLMEELFKKKKENTFKIILDYR